jgi:hypothetical protein
MCVCISCPKLSCVYFCMWPATHPPHRPQVETIYQNLKGALPAEQQLDSVHFHRIPVVDQEKIDAGIEKSVSVLQGAVDLGRRVRAKVRDALKAEGANLSERVPLVHMLVTHFESAEIEALKACEKYLLSSSGLNVKSVTYVTDFKGVIKFSSQPNMKTVGRKAGKEVRHARAAIEALDQDTLSRFHLYTRAAAGDEGKEGVRGSGQVKCSDVVFLSSCVILSMTRATPPPPPPPPLPRMRLRTRWRCPAARSCCSPRRTCSSPPSSVATRRSSRPCQARYACVLGCVSLRVCVCVSVCVFPIS